LNADVASRTRTLILISDIFECYSAMLASEFNDLPVMRWLCVDTFFVVKHQRGCEMDVSPG